MRRTSGAVEFTGQHLAAAFVAFSAAIGVVATGWLSQADLLITGVLLVLATAAAYRAARIDVSFRFYLVGLLLFFVAAPLYRAGFAGELAEVWWVLSVWLFGWAAGVGIAHLNRLPPPEDRPQSQWKAATWPFLLLGGTGLLLQALGYLRGESQYSAQLKGLVDTGPDALLIATAPAAIAIAFWSTRARPAEGPRWTAILSAIALVMQTGLMTVSGFRGAAPSYLITVWLIGLRLDKRPKRLSGITQAAALCGVIVALFLIASQQRTDVTSALGRNPGASTAVGLRELPEALAQRMDYSVFVRQALLRSDHPDAAEVVSLTDQLKALIPRAAWPSKPPVYYGRDVARVFYDVPEHYKSSETITWLGDLYVQGRSELILLAGFMVGFVLARAMLFSARTGLLGLVIYCSILTMLSNVESPLVLAAGNSLRIFVVLVAAYWGGRILHRGGSGVRGRAASIGVEATARFGTQAARPR